MTLAYDENHLADAISRIVDLIKLAAPTSRVVNYFDPNIEFPHWFVYLRRMQLRTSAAENTQYTAEVGIAYVLAPASAGYSGVNQRQLYVDGPKVLRYLNKHPRLTYSGSGSVAAKTIPPMYLLASDTSLVRGDAMPFGVVVGDRYIGFEWVAGLNFTLPTLTEET